MTYSTLMSFICVVNIISLLTALYWKKMHRQCFQILKLYAILLIYFASAPNVQREFISSQMAKQRKVAYNSFPDVLVTAIDVKCNFT